MTITEVTDDFEPLVDSLHASTTPHVHSSTSDADHLLTTTMQPSPGTAMPYSQLSPAEPVRFESVQANINEKRRTIIHTTRSRRCPTTWRRLHRRRQTPPRAMKCRTPFYRQFYQRTKSLAPLRTPSRANCAIFSATLTCHSRTIVNRWARCRCKS